MQYISANISYHLRIPEWMTSMISIPLTLDSMKQLLENNRLILMEAAIVERLRRNDSISLHPTLVHAPLVYEPSGRQEMARIYQQYIDISRAAGMPFIMNTPTWRTNQERVRAAGIQPSINEDAVGFLKSLAHQDGNKESIIKIGGTLGCKNDCYLPKQGLSAPEAEQFHLWQIERLTQGGVDFLLGVTLPSVQEALGLARAMASAGLPYFISFVIDRTGRVLDQTPLMEAIDYLDHALQTPPLAYMVNCSYPTFICAEKQPSALFERLLGCAANASSLDHCELDNAENLEAEQVSEWVEAMLTLNREYGMKMLGGCCGTNGEHLRELCKI